LRVDHHETPLVFDEGANIETAQIAGWPVSTAPQASSSTFFFSSYCTCAFVSMPPSARNASIQAHRSERVHSRQFRQNDCPVFLSHCRKILHRCDVYYRIAQ
jgi:hypothetical protein